MDEHRKRILNRRRVRRWRKNKANREKELAANRERARRYRLEAKLKRLLGTDATLDSLE